MKKYRQELHFLFGLEAPEDCLFLRIKKRKKEEWAFFEGDFPRIVVHGNFEYRNIFAKLFYFRITYKQFSLRNWNAA